MTQQASLCYTSATPPPRGWGDSFKEHTEDDSYCIDVIRQVHAVQKALEGVSSLVLENHLNTCVTTAIRGNDVDERQRMIGEIVGVFQETGKI